VDETRPSVTGDTSADRSPAVRQGNPARLLVRIYLAGSAIFERSAELHHRRQETGDGQQRQRQPDQPDRMVFHC
jgi:hypothetical protein